MRTGSLCVILVGVVFAGDRRLPAQQPAAKTEPPAASVPIEKVPNTPHLPNAYRLNSKVISGGLPEGDAAFAELEALGVKTLISVDGARPDVELAHRYRMQYVHLPVGYDGIPNERLKEIAKAVRDLPGPIYLHCHHGQHRSPAAAVAACVSLGLLQPEDALGVLKTAGTGENYRGLYAAAQGARRLDDRQLDALAVEFRETVDPSPLGESMLAVERANDHLQLIAKAGWRTPPDEPALDAAHEALLLKEQFTELLRLQEIEARPQHFRELARAGEATAGELEAVLRETTGPPADGTTIARLNELHQRVTNTCAACHREFRDAPGSKSQ